jgi:hypothetical protein
MRIAVLIPLLAVAVSAQDRSGLPPELLNLAKIKVKMAETLERLPNFTCLQTVERSRRLAGKGKYELLDTLRLEVAMVDKREKRRVTEMVSLQAGAIGDGVFGSLARGVFTSNAPQFQFFGETERDGRKLLRYDFQVALMHSGFQVKVIGRGEAVVAYRGSFWADAENLDVVRLEVVADEIPLHLQMQRTSDTMVYERMQIGERTFLMPRLAEMSLIDLRGNENRNRIELSSCKQYTGESVLTFNEVELKDESKPAAPRQVEIPAGLSLPVKLETSIEEGRSAVGDPITAVVESNIKQRGQLIIPKGAKLAGRITRLVKVGSNRLASYWVGFEFTLVTFEGAEGALSTAVEEPPLYGRPPANVTTGPRPSPQDFPMFQQQLRLPRGSVLRVRTVEIPKEKP